MNRKIAVGIFIAAILAIIGAELSANGSNPLYSGLGQNTHYMANNPLYHGDG